MTKRKNKLKRKSVLTTHMLNIIVSLSAFFMTILLSEQATVKIQIISGVFSMFIFFLFFNKNKTLQKTFKQKNIHISLLALIFSSITCYEYLMKFFYLAKWPVEKLSEYFYFIPLTHKSLSIYVGLLAFPAIFVIFYISIQWFSTLLKNTKKSFSVKEKKLYLITFVFMSLLTIFIFNKTNAFYLPKTPEGNFVHYDVIYTSDSGAHILTNVYFNVSAPENDIRQPLFALFSLPFSILATVVSNVFYFVPNGYVIFISLIQIALLLWALMLVSKLVRDKTKILFILMFLSYPTLLFSLTIEQYIFSLFWLILFIYHFFEKKKNKSFLFAASTGSLLTNSVVSLLYVDFKNIKKSIIELLSLAFKFLSIVIVFGRSYLLINIINMIKHHINAFGGINISFYEKLLQYLNFVASCFIAPRAGITLTQYTHPSFQLNAATTINLLGIIILILAFAGFALNFKNKFARFSFTWVLYSFILLVIVGWGTKENGLILYTLYFSWAFMVLIYLAIEKLLLKNKKIKQIVYVCSILIMIILNFKGLYDLISFGVQYYPIK